MTVKIKGNCYVLPKDKESSEGRVSRFKKMWNRSRINQIVKMNRYRKDKLTKREERNAALIRENYREERERKKYYL